MDQTINYRQKILFYGCQQLRERRRGERAPRTSWCRRPPPPRGAHGPPRSSCLRSSSYRRSSSSRARAERVREHRSSSSRSTARAVRRRAPRARPRCSACARQALWRGVWGGGSPPAEGRRRRKFCNLIAQKANTSARASEVRVHRPAAALSLCVWCRAPRARLSPWAASIY